jgi:hypothetical protein
MIMKNKLLVLLAITLFFSNIAYCEEGFGDALNEPAAHEEKGANLSDEQRLLAKVNQVYVNYSQAHPTCGYQPTPSVSTYPQQMYLLTNPYTHGASELNAINFKIRNFVLDGASSVIDPSCGVLSIKCASFVTYLSSSNFYCERVHSGQSSDPSLLADPTYNNYLAYQTIYNLSAMPRAQKNFGLLKQFSNLNAFPPYSSSQIPNPSYEYNAVAYSTFNYPDPALPQPNYNNTTHAVFLGSAENLKSVCQTIQYQNLSPKDAAVRFSQYFGIPPDSPDVVRAFTFFKLRNNPHVSGQTDGNMFRPCPVDGNIETPSCLVSALVIPHNCNNAPPPYDGTTVSSFLASQFYAAYCSTPPNRSSGMPIYYPWTGQGFTYDWYPWHISLINVQGASEYIPANNSGANNIEVVKKKTIEEFLSTCDFN